MTFIRIPENLLTEKLQLTIKKLKNWKIANLNISKTAAKILKNSDIRRLGITTKTTGDVEVLVQLSRI